MHRLIAVLMSLFWLLNAVAASAFMSGIEKDDGGFLIPICSGGQVIFLDLSDGASSGTGDEQDPALSIDCPLLAAMATLPELLGQSDDVKHIAFNDTLGLRSLQIPGNQAVYRPVARGPPTLS